MQTVGVDVKVVSTLVKEVGMFIRTRASRVAFDLKSHDKSENNFQFGIGSPEPGA